MRKSPQQIVAEFQSGGRFTAEGKLVVEMYEYSCSPARIDGKEDAETVAIRLKGEPEGLTPYDHRKLKAA